jgi:hypothetical protein
MKSDFLKACGIYSDDLQGRKRGMKRRRNKRAVRICRDSLI